MEKKLTKWNQSNYEIELIVTPEEKEKARQQMLKGFQKDMDLPGFRKWFVPLSLVEQNIKPEYMNVWIYEEVINKWLREIINENQKLKFVGEPYDVNQNEKDWKMIVTFRLDVFPEVEILNDDWTSHKMKKIETEVTEDEIKNAVKELKRNYADYQDHDVISTETISKISMEYLDKDWTVKHTSSLFIWEPEYNEDPFYKNTFVDKKKDESLELNYKHEDMPKQVQFTKSDDKPHSVRFTVKDIKKVIYPEMTEEMLTKLFGKDSTVKNEAQLKDFITDTIKKHKSDQELVKLIEEFLNKTRWSSMKVDLPKTLIEKEYENRLHNLEHRFWDKERFEWFFKQMWDEKAKAFVNDMKKSAAESLEKYFILMKAVEKLWLDVNWNNPQELEAERKIYEALTWGVKTAPKKAEKVEEKGDEKKAKKTEEKPTKEKTVKVKAVKKAPAKVEKTEKKPAKTAKKK